MENNRQISHQMLLLMRAYLAKQPIQRAYLFGSYSRGEATAGSDIDVLVEVDKEVGLFQFAKIQLQLEELLKQHIDLVSANGLSPYIGKHINSDKILIYEREMS